jgi:L-lactate dehydrogenase complex protein LldG
MQTNKAKSAIFASIRRNLAESLPFDKVHDEYHSPQQSSVSLMQEKSFVENVPLVAVGLGKENLAESFRENLISVGGNCAIVKSESEAVSEINRVIAKLNPKKIAVSDSVLVSKIRNQFVTDAQITEKTSAGELFDCDLGITAAQFGIAETGTLVLESEKEFSRLASLVPPVHLCVLDAANVRQTLGETLKILEKDLSRTVTFITGPSRTSDIELTLAIGVHGPAELYVILIVEE